MAGKADLFASVRAPTAATINDRLPGVAEVVLTASGTTEASNGTALLVGKMYTLWNSTSVPTKFSFHSELGQANQCGADTKVLGPYGRFDWEVEEATKVVYCEAADGVATFRAHVWPSSM